MNVRFPTEYVASRGQCQAHRRYSKEFNPWEPTSGQLLPHGAGPHPCPRHQRLRVGRVLPPTPASFRHWEPFRTQVPLDRVHQMKKGFALQKARKPRCLGGTEAGTGLEAHDRTSSLSLSPKLHLQVDRGSSSDVGREGVRKTGRYPAQVSLFSIRFSGFATESQALS